MAWKEGNPVGERRAFVDAVLADRYLFDELCELFGISRKTGYKYLGRFLESGPLGLENQSRAALHHPNATEESIRNLIIAAKRDHPRWGPLKLVQYLERANPELELPATSTVGAILKREGLVVPRPRRRPSIAPKKPTIGEISYPHQVNNLDFKGHFRTRDGLYCYPLTMTDSYSRSLLLCKGMLSPNHDGTKRALERSFREHGLPDAIRSDNGEPFVASRSLGGLSQLGVWLVRLGVTRHRSRLASPQDNGLHERMHRTLKEETALPPGADLKDQQRRFDSFMREYNEQRPHQSLDGQTPSSLYAPARRSFPTTLAKVEYEGHFEVRSVRTDGTIKWKGEHLYAGVALVGQPLGLLETAYGIWSVYFGPMLIGLLDETRRSIVGVRDSAEK